jgi:hypothetical protein
MVASRLSYRAKRQGSLADSETVEVQIKLLSDRDSIYNIGSCRDAEVHKCY